MKTVSRALIPYTPLLNPCEFIQSEYTKAVNTAHQHALSLEIAFLRSSHRITILCIQVGLTRFKAANLPLPLPLKSLKKIQFIEGKTVPWRQQNLHLLFRNSLVSPLAPLMKEQPQGISLSIFGPLFDHSRTGVSSKQGLPKKIKEELEHETARKVLIDVNAVSWAIGALEYLKLTASLLSFPALAILLGKKVDIALIENPTRIKAIEIWAMNPFYPRLSKFLRDPEVKEPINILEKKFLQKLFNSKNLTEEQMIGYQSTYNSHFQAFSEDICEEIEKRLFLPKKIHSLLIGGDLSRYIDLSQTENRETCILTPRKLTEIKLSNDHLQLLGCLRKCHQPFISTTIYPSEPEINRCLNGNILNDLRNHEENIKFFFQIERKVQFERLTNRTTDAPVAAFKTGSGGNLPVGVFKKEKHPSLAEQRQEALFTMRLNGFDLLPGILKNKNGCFTTILGNTAYSCFEYLEPDPDQKALRKLITFKDMLALTSIFHKYSRPISLNIPSSKNNLDKFMERFSYFSDSRLNSWITLVIEKKIWDKIIRNGKYFTSKIFSGIYGRLPTQVIHGNNTPKNILFSGGKPFFIDLSSVSIDVRLLDFALFAGWNYLKQYNELLTNNTVLSVIETHYGKLEDFEKTHFHTLVVFKRFELLASVLQMLKKYLIEGDLKKIEELRGIFIKSVAAIDILT